MTASELGSDVHAVRDVAVVGASGAGTWSMLMPFPPPPFSVAEALNDLALVRAGDDAATADLGGPDAVLSLPRPWDPSTCPPVLRERVWRWVDQVATWLNHEHAWRSANLVPPCWPAHPHLARELPVLACLRHQAGQAFAPDLLEDWHRYALPHFLDRMTSHLGDSGCRTSHTDWPAAGRYDHFAAADAVTARLEAFQADTRSVPAGTESVP